MLDPIGDEWQLILSHDFVLFLRFLRNDSVKFLCEVVLKNEMIKKNFLIFFEKYIRTDRDSFDVESVVSQFQRVKLVHDQLESFLDVCCTPTVVLEYLRNVDFSIH